MQVDDRPRANDQDDIEMDDDNIFGSNENADNDRNEGDDAGRNSGPTIGLGGLLGNLR